MKRWKKHMSLLLAAVMCLSLTACGGSSSEPDVGGTDWRTTGIWRGDGTITRDGEDTDVLVCVHKADSTFYYDMEEQELFDSVDYPITLASDAWEAFQSIDFADLNDDGNSDVTMKFNDGGSELLMVWFWDTESEEFVYQPEESQLGEDDEQGALVTEDGDVPPAMLDNAQPFANMESLQADDYEDGTYYYLDDTDITEEGQIVVVNTVVQHDSEYDSQTLEDYLTDCALDLGKAEKSQLQTIEENDTYTEKMTFPVYIVTYSAGGNEDAREWVVYVMDTDRYTYLYGLCATLDAADEMKSVYRDIFAGLYLSDRE